MTCWLFRSLLDKCSASSKFINKVTMHLLERNCETRQLMGAKLTVSTYFIFSRNVKSNSNASVLVRFQRLRISEGSAEGLYVYNRSHRTSQWVVRKSFRVVHSSWCFCKKIRQDLINKHSTSQFGNLELEVASLGSTPFKSVRGGLFQTWETRIEQWKKSHLPGERYFRLP